MPGDVLLQERVEPGDEAANLAVGLARVLAEPRGDPRDAGQDDERDERQAPAHHEHRDHDAGEHEHVPEHRDHARREQVVQGVDVAGHACHEPADRIAIEELEVEPLEVSVHLHPERVHDALPGRLQDERLEVVAQKAEREQRREEHRQPQQPRDVAPRDEPVDRLLREPRLREVDERAADNRQKRDRHDGHVRPQIHEQPSHQPRVVRLANDVVVHGATASVPHCLISSSSICR